MCSTNRITLLDTYQYDDAANDYFYREPYCVKFGLQNAGRPMPAIEEDLLQTVGSFLSKLHLILRKLGYNFRHTRRKLLPQDKDDCTSE